MSTQMPPTAGRAALHAKSSYYQSLGCLSSTLSCQLPLKKLLFLPLVF